jgi:hypothetical protein
MATIDEELAQLEKDIRQLKIEYDQFFGGGRKRPPTEIEWRIELLVKRYAERAGDPGVNPRQLPGRGKIVLWAALSLPPSGRERYAPHVCKCFRIRSYEKSAILRYFGANKSSIYRSYEHPPFKSFRIRSYKKPGVGVTAPAASSLSAQKLRGLARQTARNKRFAMSRRSSSVPRFRAA